jgi:creatinine amidohydrolase/Fe(II)-dependent formamide hydrolase-like protein
VLRTHPQLVHMDVASGAHAPFGSRFYDPYSGRNSRVIVRLPFEHIGATGAYGHPELGTADKGEVLFQVAVDEVVACVREVATWETVAPS